MLLTEGSIGRRLIAFTLPLFWGHLFQQLYNTADSLIVGNFIGSAALAAVSSSGNLIFLMVGLFNGISIGAGVVIGKYFGARDISNLQKAIHTATDGHAGRSAAELDYIFPDLFLRLCRFCNV